MIQQQASPMAIIQSTQVVTHTEEKKQPEETKAAEPVLRSESISSQDSLTSSASQEIPEAEEKKEPLVNSFRRDEGGLFLTFLSRNQVNELRNKSLQFLPDDIAFKHADNYHDKLETRWKEEAKNYLKKNPLLGNNSSLTRHFIEDCKLKNVRISRDEHDTLLYGLLLLDQKKNNSPMDAEMIMDLNLDSDQVTELCKVCIDFLDLLKTLFDSRSYRTAESLVKSIDCFDCDIAYVNFCSAEGRLMKHCHLCQKMNPIFLDILDS
ncbi:MAG: hypothetical protein HRT90_03950 [Candidatus Margulisbacteria bacterium]|nr:hypothetical protein [Candidatus Margulisiibacteriota bacterium]